MENHGLLHHRDVGYLDNAEDPMVLVAFDTNSCTLMGTLFVHVVILYPSV